MCDIIVETINKGMIIMFKRGRIKKYLLSKGTVCITVILTILCALAYFGICLFVNKSPNSENIAMFLTLKDITLVVLSILGTNLLLSVIIDVYSKNKMLNEFFDEDIISSPNFYKHLDHENSEKMLNGLELTNHCNNNETLHKMYKSIRNKMDKYLNDKYYLDECAYVVHCVEKNNFFEKEILRTMKLKSYENEHTVKNYQLAEVNLTEVNGLPNFEIDEVRVNDNLVNHTNIIKEETYNNGSLEIKNGYNKKIKIYLKEKLCLTSNKSTQITIKYISRCPLDDIVSSFRTSIPCKNFSVHYFAEPKASYRVIAHAFGFHEGARSYPNTNNENEVKLGFNDWIFTDDGICITMVKK